MEFDPVRGRRAPDEYVLVLGKMKQDAVADDMSAVAARNKLLGFVDGEILERVDGEMGQHLLGVGALDVDIHHVVRLVEEHAGLLPCPLFVAPVRVFGRNYRINIGTNLRISQHVDRISYALQ